MLADVFSILGMFKLLLILSFAFRPCARVLSAIVKRFYVFGISIPDIEINCHDDKTQREHFTQLVQGCIVSTFLCLHSWRHDVVCVCVCVRAC